jgi:hypothetical protein
MAMGRRRHRLRTDVGRPLSHHRRVPFSGVTGATRRRHMLGDRTEHPEPSETMPTPGASVRTRRSRALWRRRFTGGALPWTPWPSGDDRRCRCHRPQLTSGFVSLCEIGARECVDHLIVFGEAHLSRILRSYAAYYNEIRTHRSLNKDAPVSRMVQRIGTVKSGAILGGLHHHYVRI